MSNDLPVLTASRLKDARACQRLHKFRYLDGYRPAEEATTVRFGSLIHAGLEAWWLAPDASVALAGAIAAMSGEADPFERAKAEALLVGYDARWSEERELYDVIFVEMTFDAPLVNPETGRPSMTWRLGGKLDVVVRERATGRIYVVEHKTSSEDISPGSEYQRRLRMDGQVSLYYVGTESLGYPVTGCIYDILKKPALRPKKATAEIKVKLDGSPRAGQQLHDETPEEFRSRLLEAIAENPTTYFARSQVVRLEGEVSEALADVWQIGRTLRENELAGRFPRNPDACLRYGKTCAFFGVCTGEASLDDATQFRRLTDVHPELTVSPDSSTNP